MQAWAVGPGLGTDDRAYEVVAGVLATDLPVVVDADALTVVAGASSLLKGREAPTVPTRTPVNCPGWWASHARN